MIHRVKDKYLSTPIQVRASFWFLFCTVLHRALTIITTPLFTRLLSTDEYGTYSVFNSWMAIAACFVTMYIYSGVYMQAIVKFEDEKKQYTSSMQGLSLTLSIIWFGIYLFFSGPINGYSSLSTSQMTAMFIVMWAQSVFGYWSAEQRVDFKYRNLVIITLLQTILQPLLCVLFINTFPNKVDGAVWGVAISNIICFTSLFIKHILDGKVFFSGKIWKYTLSLAIPLIPHYISSVILNGADRIMIQQMVGTSEAGIYSVAYTVSSCGVLINQGLLQTITPWMYRKIKDNRTDEIKRIAYPALIAIGVINIIILLLAPEIISIFAPNSYYDAIWVMPPVVLSIYFKFLYSLFSVFEFYYEKTKYISIATGVGAVLNILLNYFFIKLFGYYAAGYTTLVCYIVFGLMHYYFMTKICRQYLNNKTVYEKKEIIGITIGFLIIGFMFMLTYHNTMIRYIVFACIMVIALIKRKFILDYGKMIFKKKA